jgi:hypothetical protein
MSAAKFSSALRKFDEGVMHEKKTCNRDAACNAEIFMVDESKQAARTVTRGSVAVL